MSLRQPNLRLSSVFDAQESVIQSHPLLAEAPVPQFGDTEQWNLNGVVRRPARLPACAWTLVFSRELAEPSWNLLAREVSMIMLNPRHPSVIAAGLSLKPTPAHPKTVINELSQLRQLVRLAEASGLPPHPSAWNDSDLRRLTRSLREQRSSSSIRHYIETFKMLHQYGPALTSRGLRSDPWAGTSARAAAQTSTAAVVSTPVIPPEEWFPLIRAAWTYVHTFAPDILRAQQRYQDLLAQATAMTADRDTRLDRWLADPTNPIPVHADPHVHAEVNWNLLTLTLGWKTTCAATLFGRNRISSLQRIARVEHALAHSGTRPRPASSTTSPGSNSATAHMPSGTRG